MKKYLIIVIACSIVLPVFVERNHFIKANSDLNRQYHLHISKNYNDGKIDSFYNTLNEKEYQEFSNATMNIRKKMRYKDIISISHSISNKRNNFKIGLLSQIDPEREVYLFASIIDNKDFFIWKFVVLDAKTKEIYHSGFNSRKKVK